MRISPETDFPRDISTNINHIPNNGTQMTLEQVKKNTQEFLFALSNPNSEIAIQIQEWSKQGDKLRKEIFKNNTKNFEDLIM